MKIHIVLHKTIYPSNLGASVRAMGNMGAQRLILVDPGCHVSSQAKRAAVGCQEALAARTVYSNWQEFYAAEGEGVRIGFTARAGKLRPALEAEELFAELAADETGIAGEAENLYLIFGREDSGLSADDVEFCHHTCTLKTSGDYTSLNLAQAVLLALYVVRRYFPLNKTALDSNIESKPEPVYYPDKTVKTWIETLGFDLSGDRINAHKVMNRLFLRNRPSKKELSILESVLQQNIRKLKDAAAKK